LRQCLEALESGGQIAPFPVGVDDVPDQLLVSEKVYGRQRLVPCSDSRLGPPEFLTKER
jgi:hypothetical protein